MGFNIISGGLLFACLVNTALRTYPMEGGSLLMMKENWVYRRGDIYYADLNPVRGSEQGGTRPVVVIQNNTGNLHSTTLIVAAVSTRTNKKSNMPTHYVIQNNAAFAEPSVVLLEQIRTIDKGRIKDYLGKVTNREMQGIEVALSVSLAMERFGQSGKSGSGQKHTKEDKHYV